MKETFPHFSKEDLLSLAPDLFCQAFRNGVAGQYQSMPPDDCDSAVNFERI